MLELQFSTRGGRVQISCDEGSAQHLQDSEPITDRHATINRLTFDMEVDDLLVNLHELARWPAATLMSGGSLSSLSSLRAMPSTPAISSRASTIWRKGVTAGPALIRGRMGRTAHGLPGTASGQAPRSDARRELQRPGCRQDRVTLAVFQARRELGEIERMLVVCPKAAFESWLTEVQLCFGDPRPRVVVMDGPRRPAGDIVSSSNYERLPDARH